MAQTTEIEWTDVTWNPIHGCSKVSPGCAHCYAETLSLRYGQTKKPWTPENAQENVILKPHKLSEPLSNAGPWKQPCRVFVNSMSDLFHELVPDKYIARVFGVMAAARRHTFQVLTKRPERMAELLSHPEFENVMRRASGEVGHALPLPNVWLGTSIENRRFVGRADALRATPAAVRFISAEPLLGPLIAPHHLAVPDVADDEETFDGGGDETVVVPFWDDSGDGRFIPELDLTSIDWLIAGGESGPGHRPMAAEWVRDLRDACHQEGVAFFFKQWGGARPKSGGRELDGAVYDEMPVVAA